FQFTDTANTNRTLGVPAGATLRVGTNGGIWKTDSTGTAALTVGAAASSVLTAGGPVTGTPGILTLNANALTADLNGIIVAGPVADNGAGGTVTLIKTGNSAAQLNAAGTYTGGSYVNSGRLRANVVGALGTGPIFVANGAGLYLNGVGTYLNPVTLSGFGFAE